MHAFHQAMIGLFGAVGNLQEFRTQPARLADYLPWAALLARGLVVNKDGSLQRTIAFRGPDLDSATDGELMRHRQLFNGLLARLGSQWCVHVEAARRPASTYPDGSRFTDATSLLVDLERRAMFEAQGQQFETRCYLTLTFLPRGDFRGLLDVFMEDEQGRNETLARREVEHFEQMVEEILRLMQDVMAEAHALDDSATLTYLHDGISERQHRVKPPAVPMYLDAVLTDTDLLTGSRPKLGRHHLAVVSLRGFPAESYPRLMEPLNDLAFPFRWVGRWLGLDKDEARKVVTRTRRHWFRRRKTLAAIVHEQMTGEAAQLQQPEALTMAEDADVALQALGEGHLGYGYFTATFTVWDEDRDVALWQATEIARVLNEQGFAARIETLNTVEAWLGSLPGHSRADIRRPVVSTLNVADMVCLSSIWSGPSWNHHLHGPPLLVAKARGNTPFRISTQPPGSDVGHQLVIGPTGAGKSTLLAFMVLQFLRHEGAQVFVFDKGVSCRAAVLAVGGAFFDLGSPEAGIAFQPLRDLETPEQLTWAVNWLAMLLRLRGVAMSQDLEGELYRQLRILSESPPEDRTLSVFSGLVQELDARKALEAFTLSGPYGHLLDAVEAGFTANRVQAFEMERFMKDTTARDIVVPVLTYLFHRLERHFDGRPTLLLIDEAWSFLLDQEFSRQIQEWLTRLRKKNVSVVLATQNLADIAKSGIADTLIQQTMSRIHLPNDKALDPYVRPLYEGFGLNERQIATIGHALPKRDYYYESHQGNRLFELALGPVALALCASSSPEDQKLITRIHTEQPDQPFAEAFLRAKGLDQPSSDLADLRVKLSAAFSESRHEPGSSDAAAVCSDGPGDVGLRRRIHRPSQPGERPAVRREWWHRWGRQDAATDSAERRATAELAPEHPGRRRPHRCGRRHRRAAERSRLCSATFRRSAIRSNRSLPSSMRSSRRISTM